jgi:hypothetical protein
VGRRGLVRFADALLRALARRPARTALPVLPGLALRTRRAGVTLGAGLAGRAGVTLVALRSCGPLRAGRTLLALWRSAADDVLGTLRADVGLGIVGRSQDDGDHVLIVVRGVDVADGVGRELRILREGAFAEDGLAVLQDEPAPLAALDLVAGVEGDVDLGTRDRLDLGVAAPGDRDGRETDGDESRQPHDEPSAVDAEHLRHCSIPPSGIEL